MNGNWKSEIACPPIGRRGNRKAGFALIELLLAVTIFGIVSTFLVLVYQKMGDRLFLTATGYDIALSFREVQSFGISVKQDAAGGFESGYGLHFETGSATTFVRFSDTSGVGGVPFVYDGAHTESGCTFGECLAVLRIERGNRLLKFCGVLGDNTEHCAISYLDVSFLRPNPDAVIRTNESDTTTYKAARIYIISPANETRVIEVVNTGQISVK